MYIPFIASQMLQNHFEISKRLASKNEKGVGGGALYDSL